MLRQICLSGIVLLTWCGIGQAQSLPENRCTADVFEVDLNSALAACTTVLGRNDLTDTERAAALKIRSRALHKSGRLDEAIAGFEEALRLAPNDAELHVRRGWTAFDRRNLDLVFSQAQQALKLNPEYADAFSLIGSALAVSGEERFAEAKAAYDQAIRLDPSEPLHHFNRYSLLKRTYPQEAMRDVEDLVRLPAAAITKPATVNYYLKRTTFRIAGNLERAWTLQTLGRVSEARQAYDQAIKDDPDTLTYAWRAEFNLTSSEPESVVQTDIDKALALDPNFWFALQVRAKVHFYSERYEAAATDFARASKEFPDNGRLRWWYARTLRKLGHVDEASAEAMTALRVDPGFMYAEAGTLQKLGYLPTIAPDIDPRPALDDAARACMLDQDCS